MLSSLYSKQVLYVKDLGKGEFEMFRSVRTQRTSCRATLQLLKVIAL